MSNHLTVADIARSLRMSEEFVRRELGRGSLHGFKVGNQWRIDPAAFDAYMAGNSNDGASARSG